MALAAGSGTRLRPLTEHRPKALCPVGNVALLDHALARLRHVVDDLEAGSMAVNAHHHAAAIVEHVGGRAYVSVEEGEALGTAGGVARLRPWLAGRAAVVVNADTWTAVPLDPLLDGWDGRSVRVLVVGADDLAPGAGVAGCVLPPPVIEGLPHRPAGLYEVCWRPLQEAGQLEVVAATGQFVACDRPRDYLAANLAMSDGAPVIGPGARVDGEVVRSVVWPGAVVEAGEVLVDAVRTDDGRTVLVR